MQVCGKEFVQTCRYENVFFIHQSHLNIYTYLQSIQRIYIYILCVTCQDYEPLGRVTKTYFTVQYGVCAPVSIHSTPQRNKSNYTNCTHTETTSQINLIQLELNTFSQVGSCLTPKADEAKVILTEAVKSSMWGVKYAAFLRCARPDRTVTILVPNKLQPRG